MPGPLDVSPRILSPSQQMFLPNGLKVVVVERPGRPVVAVHLLFGQGAASDPQGHRGATYFAIALLGDLRERRTEDLSWERPFSAQVSDRGGAYSFQVSADDSIVGIDGFARELGSYFEMLSDAIRDPRHGEASFEWRRSAIVDGLEELEVGDDEVFFDVIARAAFGADHVYARSPFGDEKSLFRLDLGRVVARQTELLRPGGSTLLVVGDVRAQQVFREALKHFGPWEARTKKSVRVDAPVVRRNQNVVLVPRQFAQTMAICGVRGLSDVSTPVVPIEILAEVLRARLDRSLRERHGLAYGASASVVRHRFARAFVVCARVVGEAAPDGLRYFRETLATMREEPPKDEEIDRARALVVARTDAAADELSELIDLWIDHLDYGVSLSGAELADAARAVTASQIQDLGAQILAPDALQIVLSGGLSQAVEAVRSNGLGKLETVRLTK
jgi:zinc protease